SGTVVMLFQPGEETGQGARAMLDDGLWDEIVRPEVIYGQHVWPGRAGHIYASKGTAMAMSDCIKVTVRGKQAHGSQPENAIDPIVLGAYMITRLQSVVSREISGRDMAVVTVGTFHGGLKENIIPDSAEFKLNIRTFSEDVREVVLDRVRRIILAEALASGAPEPLIEDMYRFPRCYNDPDEAEAFVDSAASELGDENVHVEGPVTGSEDFGAFGDDIDVPYVYWFFGGYSPAQFGGDEPPAGNHSPFFAPDDVETTLSTGIRAGLAAVLSKVGKRHGRRRTAGVFDQGTRGPDRGQGHLRPRGPGSASRTHRRGQPHHQRRRHPRRRGCLRPGRGRRCRDGPRDRKSTRLNSSHVSISYAVFCLKKKTRLTPQRSSSLI